MGTTDRHTLDTRQRGTLALFLVTMLVGSWAVPAGWASGLVVGLGLGLTIAAAVHLGHANASLSAAAAQRRPQTSFRAAPEPS
jgi:hypothetical protein